MKDLQNFFRIKLYDNILITQQGKPDTIHRADFRLSDICNLLDEDWVKLAAELDIAPSDINLIQEEYPNNNPQQAMIMFRLWLRQKANKATGKNTFYFYGPHLT